ncbi:hypothetical protein ACFXAR_17910 [Streptomyces rubiginosohelvolus]|uniref:hypothetical protein n=1 Tax=Streptomyces rubiginosohelvolus TaxID=67362 RepID=UPI0036C76C51
MAATTSRIALVVQAELDGAEYPTGIRVSDDEIAATPMTCHCLRGDWAHPKGWAWKVEFFGAAVRSSLW